MNLYLYIPSSGDSDWQMAYLEWVKPLYDALDRANTGTESVIYRPWAGFLS
jgi:hypothetical protein